MHCTAQIGGSARGWALKLQVLAKILCLFVSLKNLFDHCCSILYFFADVVHLVVVEGADDVEHIEFKQCKVGIATILSARRKVTSTHFIKGLFVYFLYPATGHKL